MTEANFNIGMESEPLDTDTLRAETIDRFQRIALTPLVARVEELLAEEKKWPNENTNGK